MTRTSNLIVGAAFVLMTIASFQARASAPPSAAATLAHGKRVFLRCASCHSAAATRTNKTGPTLAGVVGRPNGSIAGFDYSPAMRSQHFVWDEATLDRWLTRPDAVVPGTSMAFAGLRKPADRAALIAYLKSLGT